MNNRDILILGIAGIGTYIYFRNNYQKYINVTGSKVTFQNGGFSYIVKVWNGLATVPVKSIDVNLKDGEGANVASFNLFTRDGKLNKGENELLFSLKDQGVNLPDYQNPFQAIRAIKNTTASGSVIISPFGIPFKIPYSTKLI